MKLAARAEEYPSAENTLYTAIGSSSGVQLHCGFVIVNPDKSQTLVDLAWHHRLRSDPYDCNYFCFETGLDAVNQNIVAAFCLLVAERNASAIPYGFRFENLKFSTATGDAGDVPIGHGMTCATFVYCVLNSLSLPPLDLVDWPERSDDEMWMKQIVTVLERNSANQGHVDAVTAAGPYIRLRPEEIVGSVCADPSDWPQHHEEVEAVSKAIREIVLAG
ncbi:hypothetical protein NX862_14515 [Rhodobacter sp. KR11]|uniref:hypothetical protein n=1 Tax=Rhodobacter sp. KR11 TaxID=2974588 RepID=UPI002222429A|nr:hypothetical protein [Rhodobacter sp. KR11]MCW1919971.1 hypothetical protein [Rhodobacter sp. KR11]